jgi:hypothetical protein
VCVKFDVHAKWVSWCQAHREFICIYRDLYKRGPIDWAATAVVVRLDNVTPRTTYIMLALGVLNDHSVSPAGGLSFGPMCYKFRHVDDIPDNALHTTQLSTFHPTPGLS